MAVLDLTVSVIIPLFNEARFVTQAWTGVFAQTLPVSEVIVIDVGSTDNGPAIVSEYATAHPLVLVSQQNTGQSAARNSGVSRSRRSLIAFLNQDDVWYPDYIKRLSRPFAEQDGDARGWTYADFDEISEDDGLRVSAVRSDDTRLVSGTC
jgi:glycosyltransferase involved in cell wall biosynthesis